MLANFPPDLIVSTPTTKAERQELTLSMPFVVKSCPLERLHKSAKELLSILRDRVDNKKKLPRVKMNRPKLLPPLY